MKIPVYYYLVVALGLKKRYNIEGLEEVECSYPLKGKGCLTVHKGEEVVFRNTTLKLHHPYTYTKKYTIDSIYLTKDKNRYILVIKDNNDQLVGWDSTIFSFFFMQMDKFNREQLEEPVRGDHIKYDKFLEERCEGAKTSLKREDLYNIIKLLDRLRVDLTLIDSYGGLRASSISVLKDVYKVLNLKSLSGNSIINDDLKDLPEEVKNKKH